MARSLVRTDELDRQFLQCPLCIDRLLKPKVLPCQHSFCQRCLELWAARCEGNTLTCPICRLEYTLTEEEGVAGLPDNFFVKSIIDFINRKRRVSSINTPCHGCDHEAAHYCHDCAELLCVDCAGAHRRLRLTRNHRLMTVDEYKTSGMIVQSLDKNAQQSCSTHGDEIKVYCETCDLPICSKCTATTHKKPNHVHKKLKDAARVRRVLLNQLVDRAQRKVDELREAVSGMREITRQLEIRRGHVEAQIKQRKQSLIELIESYEQDVLTELDQEYENRKAAMDAEVDVFQQVLDKTVSVCNVTGNLLKEGDDASLLFVSQETTRKLEEAITADITSQLEENGHIGFIVPDVNHGRVSTFGSIQRHSASAIRSSIKPESSPPQAARLGEDLRVVLGTKDASGNEVTEGGAAVSAKLCSPSGEVGIARVLDKQDGNYDILFRPNIEGKHRLVVSVFGRQISESPFEIDVERTERHMISFGNPNLEGSNDQGSIFRLREPWGVAVSHTRGNIVIADTGNSTIRIFDLEGNYKMQLNFPNFACKFEPVDLTLTEDENSLLVTDHSNRQVLLCNLDGQLQRLFGMSHLTRPCGVAINSIGYVFVADHGANCICVFDSDGEFIRRFGRGGQGPGEFNGPIAVAVNSKDELLVSDRENHRIQIFDPDDEFLSQVTSLQSGDGELKYPTGIALDKDDNIIVCNDWNNHVLMFNSDGSFMKRIDCDADGLIYPNGVAVMEDQRVVVVDYGNDSVRIFKNI